jgi:hypothetical protein
MSDRWDEVGHNHSQKKTTQENESKQWSHTIAANSKKLQRLKDKRKENTKKEKKERVKVGLMYNVSPATIIPGHHHCSRWQQ